MINMINVLQALLDTMQEQMSHVNREMETLRENQKERLEIKN